MGDFLVSRGTTVIASSAATATITEGVEYSVLDASKAWIRIVNTRQTGQGQTSGGGPNTPDEFAVWIDNPGNLGTSITFKRGGSPAQDCRLHWELVEYRGAAGAENEIKVRDSGHETFSAPSDLVKTIVPATAFADTARGLILITGSGSDGTGNGYWHRFLFDGKILSGDVQIRRGNAGGNGEASWVALEFTGSNWKDVQRTEFRSSDHAATPWTTSFPANNGTYSIPSALSDSAKAFLVVQFRNGSLASQGLDDCGENVELSASTTLFFTRRRTATGDTLKFLTVWVVENTQSGAGAMSVEHVSHYEGDTAAAEEHAYPITVSSTGSVDAASIHGECASCDGSGTPYPRGSASLELSSPTNVNAWVTDTGQEERWSFDVVIWPTAPIEVTPSPAALEVFLPDPAVAVAVEIVEEPAALEVFLPDPAVAVAVEIVETPAALEAFLPDPAVAVAVEIVETPAALEAFLPDPAVAVAVEIVEEPAALEVFLPDPAVAAAVAIAATPAAIEVFLPDPVVTLDARDQIVLAFARRVRLVETIALAAHPALSLPDRVVRVFAVAQVTELALDVPGCIERVADEVLEAPELTPDLGAASLSIELRSRRVLLLDLETAQVLQVDGRVSRAVELAGAKTYQVLAVPSRVTQVAELPLGASYQVL